MTMLFRRLALVLLAVALAGCNNEKTRNLIDLRADQTREGLEEAKKPAYPKSYNPLTVTDRVWAGASSLRMRRGLPLPGKYEGAHGVTLVAADPMSLQEIANALTTQTGIPVRIAAGTVQGGGASSSLPSPSPSLGAPNALPSLPGAASLAPAPQRSSGGASNDMPIAYEGPLSNLLDQVAAYYGINWRYDGASVNFSRFETRVFTIEALPGTQKVKDGMKEEESGGSSGGGSGSGSNKQSSLTQQSEMNAEFKSWDELGQTLTSMLGGVGTVTLAPSNGIVTVTTTPDIMRTVAKFIQDENRRLSRQIAINVEIYKVDLVEGTDFSVTFNAALKNLSGDVNRVYSGPTGINRAAGSLISTSSMASLPVAIVENGFGTFRSVFSALSALGDTTRVAQFPLTTLNNRPVSRRVGVDQNYVSSVQTTVTSGVSSTNQSTVETDTLRQGFSLQLTPRLLDDGRIMLQYSMSLIDLLDLEEFGPDDNKVQLPKTATRVFVQQSALKSGSTLVIGGYDDEQTAQNAQGVGNPFNFLLGGSSSNLRSHAMLFMAITPQVLDDAPSSLDREQEY